MDECNVLAQGHCWYDGSSLNANDTYGKLCAGGLDALWADLAEYYDYLWTEAGKTLKPEAAA
jgi:hypothetical protein